MKSKQLSRRTLIKNLLLGGAALPASSFLGSTWLYAEDELQLVDEASDPIALALGYKHDASQVDTSKFPKRAGEEGAKQFCNNCSLYVAEEGAANGKCAIFANKLVAGEGWCNSWAAIG